LKQNFEYRTLQNSLHLLGEGLGMGATNAKQIENIKIETKI
jgi:hypothetical protein